MSSVLVQIAPVALFWAFSPAPPDKSAVAFERMREWLIINNRMILMLEF